MFITSYHVFLLNLSTNSDNLNGVDNKILNWIVFAALKHNYKMLASQFYLCMTICFGDLWA